MNLLPERTYPCKYCDFGTNDMREIIPHEAEHLGLTKEEMIKYYGIKKSIELYNHLLESRDLKNCYDAEALKCLLIELAEFEKLIRQRTQTKNRKRFSESISEIDSKIC